MGRESTEPKQKSFAGTVAIIGFVGGVFWSAVGKLAYILNLTDVQPNAILDPWASGDWKRGLIGTAISILLIGLASIAAAFIYYWTLRKFLEIWVPALFGAALVPLVFYGLNPILTAIPPAGELSRLTIVTSVCFYILYGVFVGYSISFEEGERTGAHANKEETTI